MPKQIGISILAGLITKLFAGLPSPFKGINNDRLENGKTVDRYQICLAMTTLAATLRTFRRSGGRLPDFSQCATQNNQNENNVLIPGIEPERQAELHGYLRALAAARHTPPILPVSTPAPSLYQEVWWKLTAAQHEGFPYATFPALIALGATDVAKAICALRKVLQGNRILRSCLFVGGGELRVKFCSLDDIEIPISAAANEAEFREIVRKERATYVPITAQPPLRLRLITYGSNVFVSFIFHHAIVDNASLTLLEGELFNSLDVSEGTPYQQSNLDFYDWATWERNLFEGPMGATLREYWIGWRTRVPGLSSQGIKDFTWVSGNRTKHPIHLNAAMVDEINRRARQLGSTPFVIILAAYAIALSRWSGSRHFPLRAVGSSRIGPFTKSGLGLFMCHDPIEVDFRGLSRVGDAAEALCAEYRSSVALRIPTHMTGSGADYDVLHSGIGASINFIPESVRACAPPSQQPTVYLPETYEDPERWIVPQPSIVLELIGRRSDLTGFLAFNDEVVDRVDQKKIVGLFGEAVWDLLTDTSII